MSSDDQANAYLREATLTLEAATAIHARAEDTDDDLWAGVVKNGYDAIEQAISAAIAARDEQVPRTHPGKVDQFVDLYDPGEDVESLLLYWLRRRSDSQYVDIRGEEVNVPHETFDAGDARQMLEDADRVIECVSDVV